MPHKVSCSKKCTCLSVCPVECVVKNHLPANQVGRAHANFPSVEGSHPSPYSVFIMGYLIDVRIT